jgi:hypothetical protein
VCASIAIQPLRIRMVTARPAERTRDSRSERPLPADLGEPASAPATYFLGYAYGMHASRRQQQACVGKAAARGMCACVALVIVRSDRGHRPERLSLAACSRHPGISCMSADPRAPGCPWATAVARSSHTWRGSSSLSHRCAVCTTADWARACPATRAASCSAAHCGRTASTGSGCIGSNMHAPSCAIDHHRNRPALEPILPRATERGCFCGMLVAATTDPRRAALVRMTSLWPTLIRRPEAPCTPEKGSNRPCTLSLARISDTAQSVRESDTSNCRYQHPPAPWQTSKGKKRTPLVL